MASVRTRLAVLLQALNARLKRTAVVRVFMVALPVSRCAWVRERPCSVTEKMRFDESPGRAALLRLVALPQDARGTHEREHDRGGGNHQAGLGCTGLPGCGHPRARSLRGGDLVVP